MKLEDIKKLIKAAEIEYIDVKFCDLSGLWHHVTLPVESLDREFFEHGIGVDGSSMRGFTSIERGDMIVLPDPETRFVDPFFERPTLSFLGNFMESGRTVTPYSRCPRRVAAAAERYVASVVRGAEAIIGPEFEYYVFDKADYRQEPGTAYYVVKSAEADTIDDETEDNLGYKIGWKRGYHIAPPLDRTFNLRSEISSLLKSVGIGLKYHHHEVGGRGQHEIETAFQPLLKMADQSMLVKYIVKNHCFRMNKSATFMPKPLFNEPGSGMHVHQYLAAGAHSLFYDKSGRAILSKEGIYYIGGILKHVDSLLAFTNPSTNSFKRLVPGFEAPIAGTYSMGNRTACIRIPGYQRNPKTMRFEFRPPDATMNPYLGYAAMVMAGMDGIKNKIDPGAPLDKNLDDLSEGELEKIHQLPTSLDRAIKGLEKDHYYLLEGGVFSEDLIENWIRVKGEDFGNIGRQPTVGEFELYYDC